MQLRNANWSVGLFRCSCVMRTDRSVVVSYIQDIHVACSLASCHPYNSLHKHSCPFLFTFFTFAFYVFHHLVSYSWHANDRCFIIFLFYAKWAGPYLYLNTSEMIHMKKTKNRLFNIWTFCLFSKFVTEFLGWNRMFNNWTFCFTMCYFVAQKKNRLFNNWTFCFASTKGLKC